MRIHFTLLKPCSIFPRAHLYYSALVALYSNTYYEFQIHLESQFSIEFVSSNFYFAVVVAVGAIGVGTKWK